jgi:cell division septation protein DedD
LIKRPLAFFAISYQIRCHNFARPVVQIRYRKCALIFTPAFAFFLFTCFFIPALQQAGGSAMAIGQFEKLLVRSEPAGGDPVRPAELPKTIVCEQRKHQQTILGRAVKNWLRIRAVLNVCTGRRARRVLRRASWLLLVAGVGYLVSLMLLKEVRPVDRARIIAADQQQTITPSDQEQTITPSDQQQAIIPLDQEQATISGRSVHHAPPEEGSSYDLTSTPPDVTIDPLKNSPAVSPSENAAIPANDGGYVVQVSAERSDAKAQSSFKTLQSRYPHVLGDRSPLIRRVELGKKGIFYRAQVGPFETVEQAKQLCARLQSAGGRCRVQKNS